LPSLQPRPILLDNTILSNFALVKRAEIVLNLWPNCSTTMDAWVECRSGISLGYLPKEGWETLHRIELTHTELEIAHQLSFSLGKGERTCIAAAINRGGLFISDDRKARQVAMEMGVIVSGTLGILVVAVEREIIPIDEANLLLAQMIEHGYRSPVINLNNLLPDL
jgi:predicted nucleic acid-binding protein